MHCSRHWKSRLPMSSLFCNDRDPEGACHHSVPAASGMTLPASGPEDIARRVEYIAGEEKLELTPDGAELIARLADGALRDALSILDTCAGVTAKINADVVRRMAGVTDRSYLFRISDALEAQDGAAALAQLAQLRQQSVDVKRLTEELIAHYRALMLAALPADRPCCPVFLPEEEALYLEKALSWDSGRPSVRSVRWAVRWST